MIDIDEIKKSGKIWFSVGDVASMMDETPSLVRFWSDSFPRYIKPKRNAKGNRIFSIEDLKSFKSLHHLIKEEGMTLEGAGRAMRTSKSGTDNRVEVVDRLKSIRASLVEIEKSL